MKRKPHQEHHEEHADETWLIPYSDLLTLLLALFIVLFASSSLDKDKMAQMEAAFAAAFSGTGEVILSSTPKPSSAEIPRPNMGNLLNDAQGLNLDAGITLGSDSQGLSIEMSNMSLFRQGSAVLLKSAEDPLDKIFTLLSKNNYNRFSIVVEGHADEIEAKTSNLPSEWELSSNRAASVVRYLISKGLKAERFRVIGMGDIAPQYPNYNVYNEPIPENLKKNRRIIIKIEP